MSFGDKVAGAGMAVLIFLNLALGVVQTLAIFSGIEHWLEWHWFFSSVIAGIFVFILRIAPLNCVIGVLGAHYAWHWSWLESIALFTGMFLLIVVISLASGAAEKILRW